MHEILYRAKYAYAAQQEDELTLKPGAILRSVNTDNGDWWIVEETTTGKQGMVPTNFLEKVEITPSSSSTLPTVNDEGRVLARIVRDYEAEAPDQLTLWKNGVITVLEQPSEDWWKGDLNGKTGIFPSDHVKLIESTDESDKTETKSNRHSFKLAAYGVKQGGIGSILAGGIGFRRKSHKDESSSSSNNPSNGETHVPHAPPDHGPPAAQPKGMVLHDYEPENEDELKLMRGEYVTIVDKMDDQGWWKGTNERDQTGLFPSNFIQILEEKHAPPRRARPPTIKTDQTQQVDPAAAISPSLARPPPVPVSTRPATLLTTRASHGTDPHPPRPLTSPPVPTRRPPSVTPITTTEPKKTHKPRTPSIPLVSPDLPPIVPKHHEAAGATHEFVPPARPSRPVPTPGAPSQSESTDHRRPVPPMAKPPKVGGGTNKPGNAPATPVLSRPSSETSSSPLLSPPPRKLPALNTDVMSPSSHQPHSPPPMPKRSMPLPPLEPTKSESNSSREEEALVDDDPLDARIKKLLEPIRQEFLGLIMSERAEHIRLKEEVQDLRRQLQSMQQ